MNTDVSNKTHMAENKPLKYDLSLNRNVFSSSLLIYCNNRFKKVAIREVILYVIDKVWVEEISNYICDILFWELLLLGD
jgi:hypothetical protein